jgi:hypothetical protein
MPYADPEVKKQKAKEYSRKAYERKRAAMLEAGHEPRPAQTEEERKAYHREWNQKQRVKKPEQQKAVSKKSREKHKERRSAENRKYEQDNPEKLKQFRRTTRYGLSEENYLAMVAEQESCCWICGDFMEVPFIDHCHTTNKVRGLLCRCCNAGLGMFTDDPKKLNRAIQYLKEKG